MKTNLLNNNQSLIINNFVVTEDDAGLRLDVFLCGKFPERTRSNIKNLIDGGNVKVNGKTVKAGYSVLCGDEVSVEILPVKQIDLSPEKIQLDVVYEDEDLMVINKQAGLVVHPGGGSYSGTLVNALLYRMQNEIANTKYKIQNKNYGKDFVGESGLLCQPLQENSENNNAEQKIKSLSSVNGPYRPGIVHRLDKDTTGLMLIAKNDFAHMSLAKQIQEKTCVRKYLALLDGVVVKDEGIIETNIGRNEKDRKKMAVMPEGKGRKAITHFKVIKRYQHNTLAEFELKTGRTHQIRVHAKHIGHPVTNDPLYGTENKKYEKGQLLHSYYISFTHPKSGKFMEFTRMREF